MTDSSSPRRRAGWRTGVAGSIRGTLATGFAGLAALKIHSGYRPEFELHEAIFHAAYVVESALAVLVLVLPRRSAGTLVIGFALLALLGTLLLERSCGCFGASIENDRAIRVFSAATAGALGVSLRMLTDSAPCGIRPGPPDRDQKANQNTASRAQASGHHRLE